MLKVVSKFKAINNCLDNSKIRTFKLKFIHRGTKLYIHMCISVNNLINYKCSQLIPVFHETYPSDTSPSVHSLGLTYLHQPRRILRELWVEERGEPGGECNLYLFVQTMHVFLKFLRYSVSPPNYKCCSRRVRGS